LLLWIAVPTEGGPSLPLRGCVQKQEEMQEERQPDNACKSFSSIERPVSSLVGRRAGAEEVTCLPYMHTEDDVLLFN
jgi:hypothetical protein